MSTTSEISLITSLSPGTIGAIVRLNGLLYAEEYGWDWTFEAYVAEGLAKFALNYDPKWDRIWVVQGKTPPESPPTAVGGEIKGCIAIAHASETDWQAWTPAPLASDTPPPLAQLRWFLVHPLARGQGLGKQLMNEALQFCREVGYKSVFLWTTSDLVAAAHVYLSVGFRKTEEKTHLIWGKMVTEERYEMSLKV